MGSSTAAFPARPYHWHLPSCPLFPLLCGLFDQDNDDNSWVPSLASDPADPDSAAMSAKQLKRPIMHEGGLLNSNSCGSQECHMGHGAAHLLLMDEADFDDIDFSDIADDVFGVVGPLGC